MHLTICELSHGTKSIMPARVPGSNQIQVLEDPDPPNDVDNRRNVNMNVNEFSQNDDKYMEEYAIDFVVETPCA